jgi:hypothetical protein
MLTTIAATPLKVFFVRADEILTAFLELESAIRGFLISDVKYLFYKESRF